MSIEFRGFPIAIDDGAMHCKKMTVLMDGKPVGTVKGVTLIHPAPPKPAPPVSPLGVYTASATMTFTSDGAWHQFVRHFTPKPPKPSPKQYRLKRRAAGSKRRNKGCR